MEKPILFIALFLCGINMSHAQFPSFVGYSDLKSYTDNSERTKKYRDHYSLGSQVDAWYAGTLSDSANQSIKKLYSEIGEIPKDKQLSPSEINSKLLRLNDSVTFLKEVRDYYKAINKFTGSPGIGAAIFPVWRSSHAKFFYQNLDETQSVSFFSSFILQSNLEKTAISSDLVSGTIGPLKITISTTVNDNSDTTNSDKTINKIHYGALLNGALSIPIFFKTNDYISVYFPLSARGSVDNVSVNDETNFDNTFYFGEVAGDLFIRVPIKNANSSSGANLFFNGKLAYITGGSSFYDRLEDINEGFALSQGTAGIELNNRFRIAVNFPIYSSKENIISSRPATIGIQIDPKLFTSD